MGKVLDRLRAAGTVKTYGAESAAPASGIRASIGGSIGVTDLLALTELNPLAFPGGLYSRQLALSVPTIRRARNVLCSTVGVLPIEYWKATPADQEDEKLEPLSWMARPDPHRTPAHILAWTVDDLIFHARAFWKVTSRYGMGGDSFPATFQRMPFDEVSVTCSAADSSVPIVRWKGAEVNPRDVIDFQGLTEGVLCDGARAICTAIKLDQAADRFADVALPAGVLQETGEAEPLDADDRQELGDEFEARRRCHTTAVVSHGLKYEVPPWDAEKMQLTVSRQHSSLELSRVMDVPPWTVGAPSGSSMTYQNGTQAKLDLLDFGSIAYLTTIEQTLSGPNVVRPGYYVNLGTDAWLRNPLIESGGATAPAAPAAEVDATAKARELAEIVQKIYLGVGVVVSTEEARQIVTDAGGNLPGGLPKGPSDG